ncbi:hypothetical protein [Polaromonas aquatica]|uniref:hypothetical protein n=1 Tax=Polaromonas aquatica TaxID=332657 RepID=UPI003D6533A2
MAVRTIVGEHVHSYSGTVLRFEADYKLKAIGIVYQADVLLDGKRVELVSGVIAWGFRAFPPGRRVEEAARESIELTDMRKLLSDLHAA